MKIGDKIKCHAAYDYPNLTEGKIYTCLNGLEDGIFEDRPFVTVIGDKGREVTCHASRFTVVEEET